MKVETLQESLQDVAKQLRPVTRSPFIPLIKLAKEWGMEVELRLYSSNGMREAQSELYSSTPRIIVYRKSTTSGAMAMAPDKEHLLTPRERFSIAHELGHCLAFKTFNTAPVLKEVDPAEYRKQERCMDDFARSLLVPDWLAQLWLSDVSNREPISLGSLRTWALTQCGVSGEVVAKALTKVQPNIGFMKVAEARRLANDKHLFVVFYSSYGAALELPNLHAFIEDSIFVDTIEKPSGSSWIESCYLGDVKCEGLSIAWQESRISTVRRRKEFGSTVELLGASYWISIRTDDGNAVSDANQNLQLTLFD